MKIIPFYYDDFDDLFANTYVLIDDNNNCIVIDPSKQYDGIIKYIKKNDLHLKGVLLTHGHFDHIRGVDLLIDEFKCPLYLGFDEVNFLTDSTLNCSRYMSEDFTVHSKGLTISDGEILKILNEDIVCISTPYHTIGSMCYYLPNSNVLFTGDFLFKGSVGRSDLPTGTPKTLVSSMKKLMSLADNTKIYPGHGPSSTLKEEKMNNPYIY